ncbi:YceD family protein, partial [Acinetobacter baumannii]
SGIVDISDVVYQAVTLATPSYKLCDPDCPGIPKAADDDSSEASISSANSEKKKSGDASEGRPIDPRWENLKTLFPKNDS